MTIPIKRVYETPETSDGKRVLIDRLWPRGLTKQKAAVDLWLKDIAPSAELRKWFGHEAAKWPEFQQRYRAGLATRLDVLSAEQPVLQLDQLLSSLRAQRRTASVDLDQALGGGIAPSAPDPTASK